MRTRGTPIPSRSNVTKGNISMTIYLYIKQHSKTGLKYFGRTIKNPWLYNGSGSYWRRHIKNHGPEYVETIAVFEFENQDDCTRFAVSFSRENNITECKEWANLCDEDGRARYTGNSSEKHSVTMKRKWKDTEYREKQKNTKIELWKNETYKTQMCERRKSIWEDPDYRRKTVEANRLSRTVEYKTKQKATMKELWSDPDFKSAQLAKRRKGLYFINNGLVERRIAPGEPLPNGFVKGRLKRG